MCTSLRIIAKDGSVVVGRTMDLNTNLESKVLAFPRAFEMTGHAPEGTDGLRWTTKYGFVGMNALGQPWLTDGMNEQGVYCGALYLPGFTKYQDIAGGEASKTIAQVDVVNYVLSNVANVAEAKRLMAETRVWGDKLPPSGFEFQLHYVVHDKTGACAVFEYVDGNLVVHDNALGVLTNAPTFDWHLINLRNYVNLTPNNALGLHLADQDVTQMGQGSGMLGLPGDFTPPSRFVRAVALTQSVLPVADAAAATNSVTHIINNFDLVLGVERPNGEQQTSCDYTQWTVLAELSGGNYYIRMNQSPQYYRLALSGIEFDAPDIQTLELPVGDWWREATGS